MNKEIIKDYKLKKLRRENTKTGKKRGLMSESRRMVKDNSDWGDEDIGYIRERYGNQSI
jgi:hypothetical protein